MKKYLIPFVLIVVVGLSVLFVFRFLPSCGEGTWICQNGRWVKHGNPSQPMPEIGCGDQGKTITNIPNEFNSGQKYDVYQTDDFEVKYPYWQNVDKKNLGEPEKTKLAVSDGRCNFIVTAITLSENNNFKDYVMQSAQEQIAKTRGKIITQDIQDKTAHFEGEFTIGSTVLHSVSYSFLTSKRQSYSIAFIAEKSLFDNTCRPIINDIVASVKVR